MAGVNYDGKKVQTHYEIVSDDNGTRAYSIGENGARTEINPDTIKDKHTIVMKNGGEAHADQKIKITVYKPLFSSELRYVYERT